ncbi:MAG: hypothetical protein M0D54_06150 [Hyphomonadaceae bacterium JAD_PAG50586_4]|nr:MAG: hypothetical protein M0D54_06150 [Hyphomonadaceae bacterium JAD_PAG50586_4]
MRPERSIIRGYTTFCDDIRQEVGGKVSFMGIYNSVLIPDAPFPVTLQKLCAATSIRLYRDEEVPRQFDLKVWIPGQDDPLLTSNVEIPDLPFPALEPNTPDHVDGFYTINLNLIMAPLPLVQEGFIRVRAYVGGAEWKLGALNVVRAQSTQ